MHEHSIANQQNYSVSAHLLLSKGANAASSSFGKIKISRKVRPTDQLLMADMPTAENSNTKNYNCHKTAGWTDPRSSEAFDRSGRRMGRTMVG